MASTVERLRSRLETIREGAAEAIGQAVGIVEVNGVAFGFGVAQARWGDADKSIKVAGVDADLLVGVAGHALAFAGVFSAQSWHVHNVANGALAVWSHGKGLQVGEDWATSAATSGRRQLTGGGRRMSAADMLRQRLEARAR